MKTYRVEIVGTTPLLLHHDNIEWADQLEDWKNSPETKTKKLSKPGDDRTPAWRWIGCCYHNGIHLTIPAANIMRAIMEGATMVPVPGGRSGKTFKAQSQSGMMPAEDQWNIEIGGRPIAWSSIKALMEQDDFRQHKEAVRELGFDLLVKRAKVGTNKHIRVRPQIPAGWGLSGNLLVWDEQITQTVLTQFLNYAGRYKGLGDWRPGSPTPGSFGMFEAIVEPTE